MSRHTLQPRADRPDVAEAAIGWDRPLATFFFQAFAIADGDGEDRVLEWRGTAPGELPTPEAAIAAMRALDHHRLDRVAVVDFDVHHGNGTQEIFYDRDDVLFISLHGDPDQAFPHFLGFADETGSGAGEGWPGSPGRPG